MNAAEIARLREHANRAGARYWPEDILSLLTALEQSQAALAEAQGDKEQANYRAAIAELNEKECLAETDSLRARLEAADKRIAELEGEK